MNLVAHDDLAFFVPVVDVQVLLIRRKRQAIWAGQVLTDELQLAVDQAKDTAVGQFFLRIGEKFRQTKGWVSEIESPIGAVYEVIGTVQPLTLKTICQN